MRFFSALLVFMGAFLSLDGNIELFLKPIGEKSPPSFLSRVDYIYMINLDERPEKYAICTAQLAPYGIHPFRFSAVNGWNLDHSVLSQLGVTYEPWMEQGLMGTCYPLAGESYDEPIQTVGQNYVTQRLTPGGIGILLSHLSVLQDAYDSDYQTIWVMEDDIEVIRNPHLISTLIEQLDEWVGEDGWDVLFTDRDTKGQNGDYVICRSFAPRPNFTPIDPSYFSQEPVAISSDLQKIFARYGAYSMIIRRSGMEKILSFLKEYKLFLPYDMDNYLPEGIRLYSATQDVVSTKRDALSDNSRPTYK